MGFGLHLLTCPLSPKSAIAKAKPKEPKDGRRYARPSRSRMPRSEYLASVATPHEEKLRLRREKQARYRERQRAKAMA